MDSIDAYSIAIAELSPGTHEFDFEIDDNFWKHFESSEILAGRVNVCIDVEKSNSITKLYFGYEGDVKVNCDRCLDEFYLPVDAESELTVYVTDDIPDEDDEMSDADTIYLLPSEHKLYLGQYIYESISLSLPMQRFHPDDANGNSTCNKEMLAKLKELQDNAQAQRNESSPWSNLNKLSDKE